MTARYRKALTEAEMDAFFAAVNAAREGRNRQNRAARAFRKAMANASPTHAPTEELLAVRASLRRALEALV